MSTAPAARRIVFTGDILQVNHDGTPKMSMETHWLADLLRYQVSLAAPEAGVEVVSWEASGSRFDGARFYALNGMPPSVESWAQLEAAGQITYAAAEYLRGFFADAVVIGNTMSTFLVRTLDAMNVPYLDFILHPARFLDDVCFGIRTNAPEMFAILQANHYPEEAVRLQASLHRAGLRRPPAADIAPDAGLFTAQHGIDKALVRDGRFCTIEDYRDGIAAFLERHQYVYVKPHPYARQTARIVAFLRALAQDSQRIRLTHDNVYALLSHTNVSEVCGISSCAVYEADYFGKSVTFLSESRMRLSGPHDPFDPTRFVPIYDAFFNPGFWRRLLTGVCTVGAGADIELPRKTSRLRNNLSLYWGYGHLDWEIPLRTIGIEGALPAAAPPSGWDSHDEGLRLLDEGHHDAAVECVAAALLDEETVERWTDWATAQRNAGRAREAEDGFRMATRLDGMERNATGALDSRRSPATDARAHVRQVSSGQAAAASRRRTVLVKAAHTTDARTVSLLARSLFTHGYHASFTPIDTTREIPPTPEGLENAQQAWAAAFVAASVIALPSQASRTMPVAGHIWIGDRLVALLLACHFTRLTRLDTTPAPAAPPDEPLSAWLLAGRGPVDTTLARISAEGLALSGDAGEHAPADEQPPSAPVLLAHLWLTRLREHREPQPSGPARPLGVPPATSRAGVALVRCCLNDRQPRLALALCAEYAAAARAEDSAVAAELDYHAAHALRTLGRDADAWPLYERVRRAARSAEVPATLVSGACYHLAVAAQAAGRHDDVDALSSECLRLQPNHGAARTLLDRARATRTSDEHPLGADETFAGDARPPAVTRG